MGMDTKVFAKPTMANWLYDRFQEKHNQIRRAEKRNFSQGDFAKEIGMIPQTLSRYMNGDTSMTMDQAVLLLRYFGTEIVDQFEYNGSTLDRDTAIIVALMPRLNDEQRKLVVNFLERSASGEENNGELKDLLAGA